MQRTLKRWLVSFPYDDTVQYGSLLGLLGLVRRTISVCTMCIVISAAIALPSDAGPTDRWEPYVLAALVLGALAAVVWWNARWPSERRSGAFIAVADLTIAGVLLTYADPLLAMPGTSVLAVLGIYVSMLHGPRAMIAHVLLSVTLVSALAVRALDQGADQAMTLSTLVALLTVLVGVPVAVQVAWSTLRHEGMRSLIDPLTRLPNRRGMYASILGALPELDPRRPSQRVIVLSADLDGFKQLNDRFGHEAGDVSLRRVAERLSTAWDLGGRWARVGGEELVLVATADLEDAERFGAAAVALIHDPSDPHPVTASLGVVVTDQVPRSRRLKDRGVWLDALIARADVAMYEAKSAGGNRAVVHLEPTGADDRAPTT